MLRRLLTRAVVPALVAMSLLMTSLPAQAQTTDVVEGLLDELGQVEGIAPLDPVLNTVSELVLGLTNQVDDLLSDVPLVNTLALGGDDAIDAGIAFSQATFGDGADTAVLTRDDVFADGFASGAFQGRFDAPLLFTDGGDLDARTGAELARLRLDRVTLLGGEDAVDPFVVNKLETAGLEVVRVGGPTRIETAAQAAGVTHPDATHAVLVRAYPDAGQDDSQAYADLLAAGPFAAENGWPILMTTSDELHPAVADALEGYESVTIIGGDGAVSGAIESGLEGQGIEVDRVAGSNRFATAVAIAEARGFTNAAAADRLILAEQGGRDDVWAPGFASTAMGDLASAPVLLTDGPTVPTETMGFLLDGVTDNLLDGGPAVICASFVSDIACQLVGALMTLNLGLVQDLLGTLEGLPLLGDILAALGLAGLLDGGLGNLVGLLDGLGLEGDVISALLGTLAGGDTAAVTDLLEGLAGDTGTPLDDILGGITGELPLDDLLGGLLGITGGGDDGTGTPLDDLPLVGDVLDGLGGLLGGGGGGLLGGSPPRVPMPRRARWPRRVPRPIPLACAAMIDIKALRADPDTFRAPLARRGVSGETVDRLLAIDEERRALMTQAQELRAEQKQFGRRIGQASPEERPALIEESSTFSGRITALEEQEAELGAQQEALLVTLPNLPHPDAPDGTTDEDAVELSTFGAKPTFDFEPRDHVELGEALGILDVERAVKVSGSRFAFLLGDAVFLEFALVRHVMGIIAGHGFKPVIPPVLTREESLYGTAFLPGSADQIYRVPEDDLYLVGTAEVPLAGMHIDEIFTADQLPLRYGGFSTCFRREAGTYGKDTQGIFRVHQFDKVEMFSWVLPEDSWDEHVRLRDIQTEILAGLGLHGRVVDIAVGDLGDSAARKYDQEVWLPGQGRYRELTSASNCTDYQARRLRARYRTDEGRGGSGTETVHTLNGTACAVGRTIIALLETHQQADGSVLVPEVLQGLMGKDRLVPVDPG